MSENILGDQSRMGGVLYCRTDFYPAGVGRKFVLATWLTVWVGGWVALTSTQAAKMGFFLPDSMGLSMIAAGFALPVAYAIKDKNWAFWLLGFSIAIGMLPDLPLMPFIDGGVDVFMFVLAIHALINLKSLRNRFFGMPHILLAAYILVAVLSLAIAQLFGSGGMWELKISSATIMSYTAFYLSSVLLVSSADDGHFDNAVFRVLEGLVWAAMTQLILSTVTIGMSFTDLVTPDNRSLWGLGYFMRLSSLFAGPDQAGMFFVTTLPLLFWWMKGQGPGPTRILGMIYIQMMPWFLAGAGSRGAKLSLIIVIAILLLRSGSRRQAMKIIPSVAISYWIAFYYQSFPDAVSDFVMSWAHHLGITGVDDLRFSESSLQGRLLEDDARLSLLKGSWQFFRNESWLNKVIGFGPGVSGYSSAPYPTTHNLAGILFQTGLLGAGIMAVFVAIISYRLLRDRENELSYFLFASIVAVLLCGFVYEVMTWGTTLVVFLLSVAAYTRGMKRLNTIDIPKRIA